MRWANGGGWTTEIVAEPSSDRWEWRLSVADVDAAGPFSPFPGIDRTIALLHGSGFALRVGDRAEQVIDTPFQPVQFSGDEATTCRLIDGPVQDINLMTARNATPRHLAFVHLGPRAEHTFVGVDVALVVGGSIRVTDHDLAFLDAIRFGSPSEATTICALDGGAIVATASPRDHR